MINPYINSNGTKFWCNSKGEYHRENGPAIEWTDGGTCWYINGKFHREDGPAIDCISGVREWWINGKWIQ
jgi:hypothetical protein